MHRAKYKPFVCSLVNEPLPSDGKMYFTQIAYYAYDCPRYINTTLYIIYVIWRI